MPYYFYVLSYFEENTFLVKIRVAAMLDIAKLSQHGQLIRLKIYGVLKLPGSDLP